MMDKITELRNEIARSIRAVRLSCFGRKCLKECQRRMAATAPCPRASRRRWGAAVAAALLCFGAIAQEGSWVECNWEPGSGMYVCSGLGSRIIVRGGGVGSDQVITNMLGGCTNCVDMTPEFCQLLKDEIKTRCSDIDNDAYNAIQEAVAMRERIRDLQDDISTFRRFGKLSSTSNVNDVWPLLTNYIYTVDNTQTQLDKSYRSGNSTLLKSQDVAFNDGIYDYAQQLSTPLSQQLAQVEGLDESLERIELRAIRLREFVAENLDCSACPAGNGGTNDCNCSEGTGGRWCTEEQGDAIIQLLRDTKNYVQTIRQGVINISNTLNVAVQILHDGFFTSYTHIPTEDELGMRWQDLYLEGYSSDFEEYANTNILARIELLLAGMSGILTNSNDFAESGEFADSGMSATNQLESLIEGFTNDVQDVVETREENVRSVGTSLVGLFEAFRGWSGQPFNRTTLINSYSVEIGEQHWDVPAFEPSANGLRIANLIRVVCRSIMSVIYILLTVAIFVRFHIAFFQWVWKYVKWGIELMQGLFA